MYPWLYKALYKAKTPYRWSFLGRVILKATVLFLLLNLVCIASNPLPLLGKLSIYNRLVPGRERLPYGENPSESYNLSLNTLSAMFNSHIIADPKADDEIRVILIGDSATWGWLLETEDTLTGQLNTLDLRSQDGKRLVFYNLGYPTMSITKDLLLFDQALQYDPDLVIWLFTLQSFRQDEQLTTPIVANNPEPMRDLIEGFDLNLDADSDTFVTPDVWERSIWGRRRDLADLLRLQVYGVMWRNTGIDQGYPPYTPTPSDLNDNLLWKGLSPPTLAPEQLSLDVLNAGVQLSGDVPVLLVNEPMFIATGENSNLRYNSFYPRWVYDDYRALLWATARAKDWRYFDAWNRMTPAVFTDSPVHLDPNGTAQLADLLRPIVLSMLDTGDLPRKQSVFG